MLKVRVLKSRDETYGMVTLNGMASVTPNLKLFL
jgi:hypothetical protein